MATTYEETRTVLEARLRDQRDLRDSQQDGTSEYEHFQEKARATAQSLILLENNLPSLCTYDKEVAQRAVETSRARRRHERAVAPWKWLSIAAGVLTVLLIGSGWLVGSVGMLLIGVVAGAAAVAGVWMRLRADAAGQDEVRRQEARLTQAEKDRASLARQVLPSV